MAKIRQIWSHWKRLTFRWFESRHRILDGYFFTYICCKNCYDVCLIRPKINEKEAGAGPLFKKVFFFWSSILHSVQFPLSLSLSLSPSLSLWGSYKAKDIRSLKRKLENCKTTTSILPQLPNGQEYIDYFDH